MAASSNSRTVACIGTGTIGSGWMAVFLAQGCDVVGWDPADGAEERARRNIDEAWWTMERLGLAEGASRDRLRFVDTVEAAAAAADFVQESAPDDEALKIDLIRRIDAAARPGVVISSSSSKFLPSRLASQCAHPERIIVGHPFVPSHLVPLVEVVGGERTSQETIDKAMAFYAGVGKRPLALKREIEAYIANRLQHVVFQEAKRLVADGICDFDDIDKAVTWGPGIRWPIQGPVLHRHLGGGKGGVRHMIDHFGWDGSKESEQAFIDAVESRWGHVSIEELERWRDENLLVMLEGFKDPP